MGIILVTNTDVNLARDIRNIPNNATIRFSMEEIARRAWDVEVARGADQMPIKPSGYLVAYLEGDSSGNRGEVRQVHSSPEKQWRSGFVMELPLGHYKAALLTEFVPLGSDFRRNLKRATIAESDISITKFEQKSKRLAIKFDVSK